MVDTIWYLRLSPSVVPPAVDSGDVTVGGDTSGVFTLSMTSSLNSLQDLDILGTHNITDTFIRCNPAHWLKPTHEPIQDKEVIHTYLVCVHLLYLSRQPVQCRPRSHVHHKRLSRRKILENREHWRSFCVLKNTVMLKRRDSREHLFSVRPSRGIPFEESKNSWGEKRINTTSNRQESYKKRVARRQNWKPWTTTSYKRKQKIRDRTHGFRQVRSGLSEWTTLIVYKGLLKLIHSFRKVLLLVGGARHPGQTTVIYISVTFPGRPGTVEFGRLSLSRIRTLLLGAR
jgi:hypothetical protein